MKTPHSRTGHTFLQTILAFVFFVAVFEMSLAQAWESPETPRKEPKRIIFSTDFAIGLINGALAGTRAGPSDADDAFAVALALDAPALEVLGLVITYGNNLTTPEMQVARTTLDVLGVNVPVVAGATRPLPNPGTELYTGEAMDSACLNDGVEFMARQLRQSDNVTLIGIGPFTDIACLILNYPKEAGRIQELVMLAGSKPDNPLVINGVSLPDLNFTSDPRAMQIILEQSTIPLTMMLFEVTSTTLITNNQLAALAAQDNPVSRYFAAASKPHAENWTTALKQNGQVPWDSNPVWYLLQPEAYICPQAGYSITVGQPNSSASPDNALRFAPDFATRKVRACAAFTTSGGGDAFVEAILSAVGLE